MLYECISDILTTWAPLIVAIAGISLATAAFITIRHSNKQYRLLKEERLINKVIEWAIECAEYAIELNRGRVVKKERNRPRYLYDQDLASTFVSQQVEADTVKVLQQLRAKSAYIKNLVPRTATYLVTLEDNLTECIKNKLEFIHDPEGRDKWERQLLTQAESAYELNKAIYESAIKVSQEASKYISA